MKRKVAVLAGTATDTRMGADFLRCRDNNIEALEYPVSKDPQQQTVFQISSENEKKKVLSDIFDDAISKGSNDFFIYCNSLSAAFDFEPFAVSGREMTPCGATELMEVIGKEETIKRIKKGIELLEQ